MAQTPENPEDELTIDENARILENVNLGAPPPENESEAAKYREKMEQEVEKYRDMGIASNPFGTRERPEKSR
jgi:hypothetical protein